MTNTLLRSGCVGWWPVCCLLLCSCASGWKTADVDPFLGEESRAVSQENSEPARTATVPGKAVAPVESKPGTVAWRGQSDDEQQVPEEGAASVRLISQPMQPASRQPLRQATAERVAPAAGQWDVRFTPAEPRDDLSVRGIVQTSAAACPLCGTYHAGSACPHGTPNRFGGAGCGPNGCGPRGCAPNGFGLPCAPFEFAGYFPDEYLCDGGDRALPVHYDRYNRNGLDTEDTVAEYNDHLGNRRMQPTNRVCVYAPRFGAMRTVSSPELGYNVEIVAAAAENQRGVGLKAGISPIDHSQRLQLNGLRVRSRVSEVDNDLVQSGVAQLMRPHMHEKLVNAHEELTFLSTGLFVQQELARLATGIQSAAVWTRAENPVVVATTATAQAVEVKFKPQEVIGLEQKQAPGELRIIKLADKKTAQPGDILTFTIRYDNIGERELYNVQIVDNLTPRLEYVDDSATSDRVGRLVVVDNQEGSLILRFEVDDPLKGGEGGVVTFQAKVR